MTGMSIADIIDKLLQKHEALVRENEKLKAEIRMLREKLAQEAHNKD